MKSQHKQEFLILDEHVQRQPTRWLNEFHTKCQFVILEKKRGVRVSKVKCNCLDAVLASCIISINFERQGIFWRAQCRYLVSSKLIYGTAIEESTELTPVNC